MYEIVQKQNNLFLYYYAYCLLRPGLSEVETPAIGLSFLIHSTSCPFAPFPCIQVFRLTFMNVESVLVEAWVHQSLQPVMDLYCVLHRDPPPIDLD